MNHRCGECMWGRAEVIGQGEEGEDIVRYTCERTEVSEAFAIFGCGLYRPKVRS